MKNTAKILAKYAQKDILYIENLKLKNYYVYRILQNNYEKLANTLFNDYGVGIYDEKHKYRTLGNLYAYLKVTYPEEINLTQLRKNNWYEYLQIAKFGNPKRILTEFGFQVVYDRNKQRYKDGD
ncbi:hypothetical protein SAMN04244560_01922 [Thermoanaerobacter thermohydrosulfuricus]|uniref:Uncharacterized protein n=1 Tax=Thermoanaerobacter thermohydrosulfuricus TaxID=1516 RepID=A0A1G7S6J0_THETY|nr:hypothetical protein [Thermoanaerobacter thermohydrosulfuricus]SDG18603.1 hypothetical protein SAMN04244560_01922 [Thermoanaerobacter thermohydrosulfuricus]